MVHMERLLAEADSTPAREQERLTRGLLFAGLATRSLVEPVKRLEGDTLAVERGNLEVEVRVKTPDELVVRAHSVNQTGAGLREKEHITQTFGKYASARAS
jgi:nitrogen fixation/metabolism regulation signal transduction histidine kinase